MAPITTFFIVMNTYDFLFSAPIFFFLLAFLRFSFFGFPSHFPFKFFLHPYWMVTTGATRNVYMFFLMVENSIG